MLAAADSVASVDPEVHPFLFILYRIAMASNLLRTRLGAGSDGGQRGEWTVTLASGFNLVQP